MSTPCLVVALTARKGRGAGGEIAALQPQKSAIATVPYRLRGCGDAQKVTKPCGCPLIQCMQSLLQKTKCLQMAEMGETGRHGEGSA